jgi:hypothetical protein
METRQKIQTNVHAPQEKPASLQKKVLLGLHLNMASLCRLVGVCGRCVAKSTRALKLREEEKNGWVDVCLG